MCAHVFILPVEKEDIIMRELSLNEMEVVTGGTMQGTVLLINTLCGMMVGGLYGFQVALASTQMVSCCSSVLMPLLFSASGAGAGGAAGLVFGLALQD